jgi:hypothetical protein
MVNSPVPAIRTGSRCCRADSFGCLPRSLPFARASGTDRVEFRHHERVAAADGGQGLVQAGALAVGASQPPCHVTAQASGLRPGISLTIPR